MILGSNCYGKQRVRVLKLIRKPDQHVVKELTVSALLHGDYTAAHVSDDNSAIVPTDTVKNTIHILAKDCLGENTEGFAIDLANHFLNRYAHIESVDVDIRERAWQRMTIDGKPHPHSFVDRDQGVPLVALKKSRESFTLWSGITDLIVMKTTEAAFAGYPKCEFTSLKETSDRIVSTSIFAQWNYTSLELAFPKLNEVILSTMLGVFAQEFSPSVQRTLFQMGEAALNTVSDIAAVEMKLPNKHYLGIDLSPFGRENANEVFLPTDEPHGEIEAIVQRKP
jgi:urate oxidase